MDHQETTDIAVIKNDVSWLRQTMVEKFAEVSEQIRVIPIAIDTITKRTDSLEKEVNRVRNQLNNHLDITKNMIAEHQVNTGFRKNSEFLISIGKYLVPGSVVINLVVTAFLVIKDKL